MLRQHSRRTLLATCGTLLSAAIAGCTGGEPAGTANATSPEASATTAPGTQSSRATVSCDEQEIQPDVTVSNGTESAATVTVQLFEATDGEESRIYERTFEVPAGKQVSEGKKLFTDVDSGKHSDEKTSEYYAEVTTESGGTARQKVTRVARSPWNYGVMISVREGQLSVTNFHIEPKRDTNFDCY